MADVVELRFKSPCCAVSSRCPYLWSSGSLSAQAVSWFYTHRGKDIRVTCKDPKFWGQ